MGLWTLISYVVFWSTRVTAPKDNFARLMLHSPYILRHPHVPPLKKFVPSCGDLNILHAFMLFWELRDSSCLISYLVINSTVYITSLLRRINKTALNWRLAMSIIIINRE